MSGHFAGLSGDAAPDAAAEGDLPDFWAYPLCWGQTLVAQDWIEQHFHKFLSSRFVALMLAEGRRDVIGTAVILWNESYRQDPAGTLPDDDVELARLAGYGADVAGWRDVRRLALYGWMPVHIHGEMMGRPPRRLGHPFIAGIAKRSWDRKSGRAAGREAARLSNAKNRVKRKLVEIRREALSRNDEAVRMIALWLEESQMFITRENVTTALQECLGVPRVVAFREGDQG